MLRAAIANDAARDVGAECQQKWQLKLAAKNVNQL